MNKLLLILCFSLFTFGAFADVPRSGTPNDASGSITLGNTAQTALAAATTSARVYLFIENISSGDLYVNFGTTAVADQPSIKIPAAGSMVFESSYVPSDAISIIGATTGQKFVIKWK